MIDRTIAVNGYWKIYWICSICTRYSYLECQYPRSALVFHWSDLRHIDRVNTSSDQQKIPSLTVLHDVLLCPHLNHLWPKIWSPNHFPSSIDDCRFTIRVPMPLTSDMSFMLLISCTCTFIYVWATYDVQRCKNKKKGAEKKRKKEWQNDSLITISFSFFSSPVRDSFVALCDYLQLRSHIDFFRFSSIIEGEKESPWNGGSLPREDNCITETGVKLSRF